MGVAIQIALTAILYAWMLAVLVLLLQSGQRVDHMQRALAEITARALDNNRLLTDAVNRLTTVLETLSHEPSREQAPAAKKDMAADASAQ